VVDVVCCDAVHGLTGELCAVIAEWLRLRLLCWSL